MIIFEKHRPLKRFFSPNVFNCSCRWNTSFSFDKLNWTWSIFNRTSPHEVFIQNANHEKYSSERRGFPFQTAPKWSDKNQKQTAKFQTQICLQRIYNLFKYGQRERKKIFRSLQIRKNLDLEKNLTDDSNLVVDISFQFLFYFV